MAALWLCLGLFAQSASAETVELRRAVCTAALPEKTSNAAVAGARFTCGKDAPTENDAWLWLRLDATRLHDLPRDWHLLVDQTRFDQIAILVARDDGLTRVTKTQADLQDHWAPGGMLKFQMDTPGREIRGLFLGFRRIDDLSLMRKIAAVPSDSQPAQDSGWILLMGLFAGTLLSAFLYNVVIHAGRRYAFQRWYLLWVAIALAYGLVWTTMAAFVVPGLVGPLAVRLDFVLVGLLVATGNMFFFSVIEEGKLPIRLIRVGRSLAMAGAVLGFAAAADQVFPAVLTDRLLNYVIALTAVTVGVSCWIAVRRGSRVIWFYMAGWGPVICVFLARLARNLGLTPQYDFIDMATFAALALEALVLSLAIADRFRLVRQELELVRQRQAVALAEAEALRLASQTDFLTGLGNRAAFQEAGHGLVELGEPFALFLIDVDFLKDANDRLGHAGGDALLQRIGTALCEVAAQVPQARVARIGGDEFAILLPGGTMLDGPFDQAIATLQGARWRYMDQDQTSTLSVGSAQFPNDAPSFDLLYQNADLALYTAKRLGRARHCHYDPLQRVLHDLQNDFAGDAGAALERDEFRLHLEPIVTLSGEDLGQYEALLYWQHPKHGLMRPERFAEVLVAERIGLRVQEHALELALRQVKDHSGRIAQVGVNFTAAQLSAPLAATRVLERLAHHGVPPSSLCVEVTESVVLGRAAATIQDTLRTLQQAGVCVALDSFGTGHASFAQLRELPADRIKIDRSFIASINQPNSGTVAIVRAIVGLARGLGKTVIAEGVETETQALLLRQLGCELAQGSFFGHPEPQPLTCVPWLDASGPQLCLQAM